MTEQSGRLANKVAIITGGASGIGAACSRQFIAEGGRVVITDLNAETGNALVNELGEDAIFLHQDVTDPGRWRSVIDYTMQRFGRLDILVNNAGIGAGGPVDVESLESWQTIMAVNSDAVFLGCRAAVNAMKENGSGSIINMSSVHGMSGAGFVPAYSASKGAVRLLSKSVAAYCGEMGFNIRCNSVHPGYIDTPLLRNAIDAMPNANEMWDQIIGHHALGRLGTPEEVANMVLFLASDESSFVTGTEMIVDGGYLLA
jgi:3(or 17)beta-hydroxysteroid dehydrogenase